MTVDEFSRKLYSNLRTEADLLSKKVKLGQSDGFQALVDATIAATLDRVANSVLDASIEHIGRHKI